MFIKSGLVICILPEAVDCKNHTESTVKKQLFLYKTTIVI